MKIVYILSEQVDENMYVSGLYVWEFYVVVGAARDFVWHLNKKVNNVLLALN